MGRPQYGLSMAFVSTNCGMAKQGHRPCQYFSMACKSTFTSDTVPMVDTSTTLVKSPRADAKKPTHSLSLTSTTEIIPMRIQRIKANKLYTVHFLFDGAVAVLLGEGDYLPPGTVGRVDEYSVNVVGRRTGHYL